MSITDAVLCREFDDYSLLAFTMSNETVDMYMNGMQLIRGKTQVSIALFPYDIYDLIKLLPEHKNQTLTYRQIYRHVWDDDEITFNIKLVSNLAYRLRSKLMTVPGSDQYIQNIVGVGYKLHCA